MPKSIVEIYFRTVEVEAIDLVRKLNENFWTSVQFRHGPMIHLSEIQLTASLNVSDRLVEEQCHFWANKHLVNDF